MADVRAKLDQAGFFLQEMARVQANRQKFTYELSAFLSACTSVAYYLRIENGKAWYKQMMQRAQGGEFPHISYYLDKRRSDVHDDVLDVLGMSTIKVNARLLRPIEDYPQVNRDEDGHIMSIVLDDGNGPALSLIMIICQEKGGCDHENLPPQMQICAAMEPSQGGGPWHDGGLGCQISKLSWSPGKPGKPGKV